MLEVAAWALAQARTRWPDGVPSDIRSAATEAADHIERVTRHARRQMEQTGGMR